MAASARPQLVVVAFCGAGGSSLGVHAALPDANVVGIDNDADACRTHRAAGFATIQADAATFPLERLGGAQGLWLSPPCTAFSTAGRQSAVRHMPALLGYLRKWRLGDPTWGGPPPVWLVTEPLRWALAIGPEWVACEQVPEVLPLWHALAGRLRGVGYSAWAGVLNAADYGVPQTRRRAILMASRTRQAFPPVPTHARSPQPRLDGTELPAWATMARELERRGLCHGQLPRWCYERPATTVQGDRRIGRPGHKDRGGGEGQFDRDAVTLSLDGLAALQDFPPGYRFTGSASSATKQAGNAVPVGLAAAIVGALTRGDEKGRAGNALSPDKGRALSPDEERPVAEILAASRAELDWLKEH